MYKKIYNPKTNRFVKVNGSLGQNILKHYLQRLRSIHGGADTGADTVADTSANTSWQPLGGNPEPIGISSEFKPTVIEEPVSNDVVGPSAADMERVTGELQKSADQKLEQRLLLNKISSLADNVKWHEDIRAYAEWTWNNNVPANMDERQKKLFTELKSRSLKSVKDTIGNISRIDQPSLDMAALKKSLKSLQKSDYKRAKAKTVPEKPNYLLQIPSNVANLQPSGGFVIDGDMTQLHPKKVYGRLIDWAQNGIVAGTEMLTHKSLYLQEKLDLPDNVETGPANETKQSDSKDTGFLYPTGRLNNITTIVSNADGVPEIVDATYTCNNNTEIIIRNVHGDSSINFGVHEPSVKNAVKLAIMSKELNKQNIKNIKVIVGDTNITLDKLKTKEIIITKEEYMKQFCQTLHDITDSYWTLYMRNIKISKLRSGFSLKNSQINKSADHKIEEDGTVIAVRHDIKDLVHVDNLDKCYIFDGEKNNLTEPTVEPKIVNAFSDFVAPEGELEENKKEIFMDHSLLTATLCGEEIKLYVVNAASIVAAGYKSWVGLPDGLDGTDYTKADKLYHDKIKGILGYSDHKYSEPFEKDGKSVFRGFNDNEDPTVMSSDGKVQQNVLDKTKEIYRIYVQEIVPILLGQSTTTTHQGGGGYRSKSNFKRSLANLERAIREMKQFM